MTAVIKEAPAACTAAPFRLRPVAETNPRKRAGKGSKSSGGDEQREDRAAGAAGDELSRGEVPAARMADRDDAEPPRLLLCFDRAACPDRYIQLRDYCVESLDLRSGSGRTRPVFRFSDNEYFDFIENVEGRDAPPIEADRVVYKRLEEAYAHRGDLKPQLIVHASLDGYLLVSFVNGWFVINPATRQWVALPNLHQDYEVVGFYAHATSGEYRVLCLNRNENEEGLYGEVNSVDYGVLTVSSVQLRPIGRPILSSAPTDHGLGEGVDMAYIAPPIQLKRNQHLHWPPQESQGFNILVFDTEKEEFSWMEPPVMDQDMRLLEFPNGNLGLSVSRMNNATTELWCLQDYENEAWVLQYRIQLQVQEMPVLQQEDFWISAVVSPGEGDVLIQSPNWLLHCDNNGTLLRQFQFPERPLAIWHVLKESHVQHQMFLAPKVDGATEPPFFNWLCDDPSR